MSSSIGRLLFYGFLRLSVAPTIIQEFLFVHNLSFLSTRSASGFLFFSKISAAEFFLCGYAFVCKNIKLIDLYADLLLPFYRGDGLGGKVVKHSVYVIHLG